MAIKCEGIKEYTGFCTTYQRHCQLECRCVGELCVVVHYTNMQRRRATAKLVLGRGKANDESLAKCFSMKDSRIGIYETVIVVKHFA